MTSIVKSYQLLVAIIFHLWHCNRNAKALNGILTMVFKTFAKHGRCHMTLKFLFLLLNLFVIMTIIFFLPEALLV